MSKAFTLIELLVTVAILGILATISIATFDQYKRRANDTVAKSHVHMIRTAQNAFIADYGMLVKTDSGITAIYDINSPASVSFSGSLPTKITSLGIDRVLPGYILDPKVAIFSSVGMNTLDATASHCYGTEDSEYPQTTKTFIYLSFPHLNGTGVATDKIVENYGRGGYGLALDGSSCP